MNKIEIANNKIVKSALENVKTVFHKSQEPFEIPKLKISVNNTDLEIVFKDNTKINIILNVKGNSKIFEKRIGNKIKVQYEINVDTNSNLYFDKFSNSQNTKELDIINLKGNLVFNQKVIATNKEQYDLFVNHLAKNSKCIINNNGITIKEGCISFNVTNTIPNGIKKNIVDQRNQIINDNNSNSIINPNLLIEEEDVEASHSAYIGPFNQDEIFYLESRGINLKKVKNLLIKGFILKKMLISDENKLEIQNIIDQYWR